MFGLKRAFRDARFFCSHSENCSEFYSAFVVNPLLSIRWVRRGDADSNRRAYGLLVILFQSMLCLEA